MGYELTSPFAYGHDLPWEVVAPGLKRQILSYDADIMVVRVLFEAGGVGAVHQHRHTQASYVASGVFDVTISGETRRLQAGDSFLASPYAWHGVVCLEAGELVDVFTPMREDFVPGPTAGQRQ
ncbi:cupin domain-containing protein [Hymenobacter sp. BT175]|uniref:cupin domain-containing protein n=1 Tax=Hymenobacter translucens TaxID=2886507 RepID=UPI001D0E97D5|nr:cupin domain-containing protein [Hymenobacter translucens]MCC2548052.1 cupin domain-containing protein [Hymenobacter translucens]